MIHTSTGAGGDGRTPTPPRLVVRYFGPGPSRDWARLVAVLTASARQHCPGWDLDIVDEPYIDTMASPLGVHANVFNTQKLDAWTRAVDAAPYGTRILLLDADTIIRLPLDDVWEQVFDVAYTTKPADAGPRFPFNLGVLFLRVSDATRQLMETWATANRRMLADPREHQVWRPAFGGINQAAFGRVRREGALRHLAVVRLPCQTWNCEDESWAAFDPAATRIVHFKGELFRALFHRVKPDPEMRPLLAIWHDAEAALPPQEGSR